MLNAAAFLCLFAAGAIAGAALSDRLRAVRDYDRALTAMFTQISVMIRYRALDVYEIITALQEIPACVSLQFLKKLPSCYDPSQDFHQLWSEAVSSDRMLGAEEKRILLDFGGTFGMSDIDGQLTSLESASASMQETEHLRNDDYTKKGRLYRSVGMLFGIMAGILVI